MKQNWASILGNVEISGNKITLVPPFPSPLEMSPVAHALVRSDIQFEQGSISMDVKLPDPDARCCIGVSVERGGELFAGLNNIGALYGFAILRDGHWKLLRGTGQGARLESERWYRLALAVKGASLELFLDGVKVSSVVHQIQKGAVNLLLQGSGSVIVRNITVDSLPAECFIVMQFTEEYDALYKEVIRPTCEAFGYKVIRADDAFKPGLIINDITQRIQEASIVIADITPNNPNVFYEVGYAHGIGKNTILLSDRKREQLPFDVSGFRTLFYENTIAGKGEVEERLRKHLEVIAT